MSHLFSPLTVRGVAFRNRIAMSPMCMYSCEDCDGMPTPWHMVHLGSRAAGGCGMVMLEATAVSPEGRISPQDLGIWSDEHIGPLAQLASFIKSQGSVPAIQLAHAGRKAGTYRPASPVRGFIPIADGGWQRVGPSAIPFKDDSPVPIELDQAGIDKVVADFVSATRRAVASGFEVIELHSAHGYLLHQFLSPISNTRGDEFGGNLENRTRLHKLIVSEVRSAMPVELALFVRVSATDWVDGGWTIDDTVELAKTLGPLGVDCFDCSSGGAVADAKIPVGPGYQVPFAERIKVDAGLLTVAVGMITNANQAEAVVASNKSDFVMLGSELLRDPQWPIHAALELEASPPWPQQYSWAVG